LTGMSCNGDPPGLPVGGFKATGKKTRRISMNVHNLMNLATLGSLAKKYATLRRVLFACMAQKTDLWVSPRWLPPSYEEQLAMAKKWVVVLDSKGDLWLVPVTAAGTLATLTGISEAALTLTRDKMSRTHLQVVACKKAFADLTACMEDIKNRYFLSPPLTAADRSLLELPDADGQRTPIGTPEGAMRVGIRHNAGNQVSFICDEDPDSKADKPKVRANHQVGYELVDSGAEGLSLDPDTFGHTITSRSQTILVDLPPGSSGKKIRAAGRYLNPTNTPGHWGTIVETVVI
jgi:hypothetical protein